MEDKEKIKQRFELLKMAKELLNEDYINKRAEDHNKWVAENEELWRTKRRNLPYPPFAQYPNDEELVRAASNLYQFVYADCKESTPVIEIRQDNDHSPAALPDYDTIVAPEPSTKKLVADELPVPTIEDIEQTTADLISDTATSHSILPGWVRRNKLIGS